MPPNSEWSRFLRADSNLTPTRWTTVHDAKGSEHLAVCIVVPPDRGGAAYTSQLIEAWEARAELESKRVIFVGATRAQKLLAVAVPAAFCDRVAAILRESNVPFEIHNLPVAAAVGAEPVETGDG
jgi:DNA helicase-2/ATP-dependent DNA helicase PcrA